MANPFAWRTLQRALEGKPTWELNYEWIVQWTEKHCAFYRSPLGAAAAADYKRAAAGERDDLPEPPLEAYDAPSKAERLRSERGKP